MMTCTFSQTKSNHGKFKRLLKWLNQLNNITLSFCLFQWAEKILNHSCFVANAHQTEIQVVFYRNVFRPPDVIMLIFIFFLLFHVGAIRVTDSPHQGAKKDSFMACHLGKLLLVCTSPRVFLTSPEMFSISSIDYSSSVIWISQNSLPEFKRKRSM